MAKRPAPLVDLTLSDSEEDTNLSSRRLAQGSNKRVRRSIAVDDNDDDVVICEGPPAAPAQARRSLEPAAATGDATGDNMGDDDVIETGEQGVAVLRDMPHPRHTCIDKKFVKATSKDNARRCNKCFCYCCDVVATTCSYWGTGQRERDHCNAHDTPYWTAMRAHMRASNEALAVAEFRASGPLQVPKLPGRGQQTLLFRQPGAAPTVGPRGLPSHSDAGRGAQTTTAPPRAPPAAAAPQPDRDEQRRATARQRADALRAAGMRRGGYLGSVNDRFIFEDDDEDDDDEGMDEHDVLWAAFAAQERLALAAEEHARTQAEAAEQQRAAAVGTAPTLPTGTCTALALPDPARDPNALELGTIRLPVKAVRGLTIDQLKAKLSANGFYYSSTRHTREYGDRLWLGNLVQREYRAGKYQHSYLKLLPGVTPEDEREPLTSMRLRQVTIYDCSSAGGQGAMRVAVRVSREATCSDIRKEVKAVLGAEGCALGCKEVLHIGTLTKNCRNWSFGLLAASAKLNDSFFTTAGGDRLVAIRGLLNQVAGWQDETAGEPHYLYNSAGPVARTEAAPSWMPLPPTKEPAYVLIKHLRATQSPADLSSMHMSSHRILGDFLVPMILPLPRDSLKGGLLADKTLWQAICDKLQFAMRRPGRIDTNLHRKGLPFMLFKDNLYSEPGYGINPCSSSHRNTPNATPFSSACTIAVHNDRSCFEMNAFWETRASASSTGSGPASAAHEEAAAAAGTTRHGPDAYIDVARAQQLVVHASVDEVAIAEDKHVMQEAARRHSNLESRKRLPYSLVEELLSAIRRVRASSSSANTQLGDCCAAVSIALEREPEAEASARAARSAEAAAGAAAAAAGGSPANGAGSSSAAAGLMRVDDGDSSEDSADEAAAALGPSSVAAAAAGRNVAGSSSAAADGAGKAKRSSRRGHLVMKVFIFKRNTSECRTLLKAWDDWPARERGENGFELTSTMQTLLRDAPPPPAVEDPAAKMLEELGKLQQQSVRSINGLLEYMQSAERSEAPQPAGLTVTLHPYQRQSLAFMLETERRKDGFRALFWRRLVNRPSHGVWYSPVFQRLSMDVPAQATGGFLAEEMGLGKTVEVMALILANPAPPSVVSGTVLPSGKIASRATLVVCAVSLVGQWCDEAASKSVDSCRIHPYHGQNRARDPHLLATKYDVVVTTYQTLQSDHGGARGGIAPCQQIHWHRVVFDEGHTLKSSGSKLFKAALELSTERRWVCTGTPINNGIDDLYGQMAAIQLMPLCKKTWFDSSIKAPFVQMGRTATPLLYVLRKVLVRHTKAQVLGGEAVLQLPPKTEELVPVFLSPEEQDAYKEVHLTAAAHWATLKGRGSAYVRSHLFAATSLLMPLRRMCSGGLLKPGDLHVPDPEARERALAAGAGGSGGGAGPSAAGLGPVDIPADMTECVVCSDVLTEPVTTPCRHWFCRECITGWINASVHHTCPICRTSLSLGQLRKGRDAPAAGTSPQQQDQGKKKKKKRKGSSDGAEDGSSSSSQDEESGDAGSGEEQPPAELGVAFESKLRVLLRELAAMRAADPSAKALVFTQFTQTLAWLKTRLTQEGFGYRTITGDMTQKKRTKAIESFQKDPPTTIFLLSMRAGSVGINLTSANYVFLLEPSMNPALEDQAIGRAWRMGQARPVTVKKLYVKGSVEERIMQVVKERRAASTGTGTAGAAADEGTSDPRVRAPVAAGNLAQDKVDLKITELDTLFTAPTFPDAAAAAAEEAAQVTALAAGTSSARTHVAGVVGTSAAAAQAAGICETLRQLPAAAQGAGTSAAAERAAGRGIAKDGSRTGAVRRAPAWIMQGISPAAGCASSALQGAGTAADASPPGPAAETQDLVQLHAMMNQVLAQQQERPPSLRVRLSSGGSGGQRQPGSTSGQLTHGSFSPVKLEEGAQQAPAGLGSAQAADAIRRLSPLMLAQQHPSGQSAGGSHQQLRLGSGGAGPAAGDSAGQQPDQQQQQGAEQQVGPTAPRAGSGHTADTGTSGGEWVTPPSALTGGRSGSVHLLLQWATPADQMEE